MFGGKKKKLMGQVEAALETAHVALAEDSKEGRAAAFHAIMPALEIAEAEGFVEEQIILFCQLGDVYYQAGDFETALNAYSDAIRVDGALGDPLVHYRLGITQFELGNETRAADELARAYMGGGPEIFDDGGEVYFEFLKTKLKPPPEGW